MKDKNIGNISIIEMNSTVLNQNVENEKYLNYLLSDLFLTIWSYFKNKNVNIENLQNIIKDNIINLIDRFLWDKSFKSFLLFNKVSNLNCLNIISKAIKMNGVFSIEVILKDISRTRRYKI